MKHRDDCTNVQGLNTVTRQVRKITENFSEIKEAK
jgi:hypothetical protein